MGRYACSARPRRSAAPRLWCVGHCHRRLHSWTSCSPSAGRKPAMSSAVLDASALLAALLQEPGTAEVAEALQRGAAISAVNLSEVAAKLTDHGMPEADLHAALDVLPLEVVPFDT